MPGNGVGIDGVELKLHYDILVQDGCSIDCNNKIDRHVGIHNIMTWVGIHKTMEYYWLLMRWRGVLTSRENKSPNRSSLQDT